jgi:hypothetical protein
VTIARLAAFHMRELWHIVAGRHCAIHDRRYRSDICPFCMRRKLADYETLDRSPAWRKAQGVWPLRRPN